MNIAPNNLQQLNDILCARCAVLAERQRRIEADLARQFEPLSPDSADRAIQVENDETLQAIRAATDTDIKQVDLALERLTAGAYGMCTRCKGPIGLDRLHALPWAVTCVGCAEA